MLENGFIKIYRSIVNWEWYTDANTTRLFLHLLLTVNYEPQKWRGIIVNRGQRVASYRVLADELKLSVQNIRTAIKRLISTGEITHKATSEYGLFTVNNYDKFQTLTLQATGEQHTANSQLTHDQQLCNKDNKVKKANKAINTPIPPASGTDTSKAQTRTEKFTHPTIIPQEKLSEIQNSSEWADFVGMRKQIKKPLTKRAVMMALSELEKLAPSDVETQKLILNQSTYHCWQGLFALKQDAPQNQRGETGNIFFDILREEGKL